MHISLSSKVRGCLTVFPIIWLFMQPLFGILLVKYFHLEYFTHSPLIPAEMLTVFQNKLQVNLGYLSRNIVGSQTIISFFSVLNCIVRKPLNCIYSKSVEQQEDSWLLQLYATYLVSLIVSSF